MKKFLFVFFALVCQFANAQQHQLSDREKIIRVLKIQEAAWNRGSLEEYMNGYWQNDSLIFIGKKDIHRGWKLTLENYKQSYPTKAAMGKLSFDIIGVELLSKTSAHVIGKWTLKRSSKEIIGGHFTLLFKKINNQWLIVLDHTS